MSDPVFDAAAFGAALAAEITRLGLSYRQAAALIGIDHASLHRIAHGGAPSVENYLRVADRALSAWHPSAVAFLQQVASKSEMWLENPKLKYLTLRVDTRDGAFLLYDRDGTQISVEDVFPHG